MGKNIAAAFATPAVDDEHGAKRQKGNDGSAVAQESAEKKDHERAIKIQMRVTRAQKRELERIFDFARETKNCANEIVRERYAKNPELGVPHAFNFIDVRNAWSRRTEGARPEGMYRNFGDLAVRELCNSYKTCLANGTHGFGRLPAIKFESAYSERSPDTDNDPFKTHLTEVINIAADPKKIYEDKKKKSTCKRKLNKPNKPKQPKKYSSLKMFTATAHSTRRHHPECLAHFGQDMECLGGIILRDSPRVIQTLLDCGDRLVKQCKIQWDHRTDSFYFLFHYTIPNLPDPDPAFASKRVVALDPGISPFQHWISPTSGSHGTLFNVSDELKARSGRVQTLIDRLKKHRRLCSLQYPCPAGRVSRKSNSQMTRYEFRRSANFRHRTTRRLKHRLARERVRVRNWVKLGHYDTAKFLLTRFDLIIAPVLKASHLLKGHGLCREAKKKLGTQSHYLFRQRLISASAKYAGAHVMETKEPGTSKTCTGCGHWHADLLLSDKQFNCPRCGLCVDRQMAGARNNLLAAYGRALGVGWDGRRV